VVSTGIGVVKVASSATLTRQKEEKPVISFHGQKIDQKFNDITTFSKERSTQREEVTRSLQNAVGLLYVRSALLKTNNGKQKGGWRKKAPVPVPESWSFLSELS
jgi:hypothetical protein